jgi:hypothetical protein
MTEENMAARKFGQTLLFILSKEFFPLSAFWVKIFRLVELMTFFMEGIYYAEHRKTFKRGNPADRS